MVIARAPFRISFGGGGSDLPGFFSKHGGQVLSAAINRYMYVEIHPFFDPDRIQLRYSRIENVRCFSEIQHPIFRQVLRDMQLSGVEVSSTADVPTGTGLGSSSSFTVALLQAAQAFMGNHCDRSSLARLACEIEIDKVGSPIGKQDQYAAVFGGLNTFTFHQDGTVTVDPLTLPQQVDAQLQKNLVMFYTGIRRNASTVLEQQQHQMANDRQKEILVKEMVLLASQMRRALESADLETFGYLLHEGWQKKRKLTHSISNSHIDDWYKRGLSAGALGGKLLGAGGGGFLLFYCPPDRQENLRHELSELRPFQFSFDRLGSQVIFTDKDSRLCA